MSIQKNGRKYLDAVITFLYPKRCPICDGIVAITEGLICSECERTLELIGENSCLKCGKELKAKEDEFCYDCKTKHHEFVRGKILFRYETVKGSLYRFKYMGRVEYAEFYGELMFRRFGTEIMTWKPDAIVAVPLHSSRLRKRGYNQAQCIADVLGRKTGIPVYKKWIKRCKKTIPQKELDGVARQNNLKKAFKIIENDVKLETIVMINDIYTTGSTIDAIARECKSHGVKNVYFLALASGAGF
ncbi:MAG: ComF family protein [Eubacteriales bacterium]